MAPCILCGQERYKKLFDVGNFSLLKCVNCGLVKTSGRRKISYKKYHRDPDYSKFENHFRNLFLTRFELITRFIRKGRVLEIGCATGVMLEIFKKAGWEVWGVEPSASAEFAKQKGIKVLNTTFDTADLPKGYFDLVIINHTLEHLKNPLNAVKKANSLLRKGGVIFIDVPNFGSLSAKLLGKRWPYILPEEHNYHFTLQTLGRLLAKSGFKVIHGKTLSGVFNFANPISGLLEELSSRPKSFVIDFLSIPGAFISTTINQGTSLAVVGEKRYGRQDSYKIKTGEYEK